MHNDYITFPSTPFSLEEFNPELGDKYFIGMNSEDHTSVLTFMNATAGVFSQDLGIGILFPTLNSAQDFINKNSDKIQNVLPILVSDVMRPVYYVKQITQNSLPIIKAKKMWMDSDATLGKNMFTDPILAQNSLNTIKQSVIEFYHKNMMEATSTKF